MSNESKISKFFEGRSVFITGATGFLGKALLEKLLRSCPTIATVFILIRSKKRVEINTRVTQLLEDELYDSIKKANPNIISKIVPIPGDIAEPDLGISKENQQKLCAEVSVIFHSAANTNFMGKLKVSFGSNVKAMDSMLQLSKKMPNLVAFVHVSTAFTNFERTNIDEVVYPMSITAKSLEKLIEEKSEAELEELKPKIFDTKPNTYIFTKALIETMVEAEKDTLPICIVRPSIIFSIWKDPIPGWFGAGHVYALAFSTIGRGLIRTGQAEMDTPFECVPMDFVINMCIAAAWELGISPKKKDLRVYNYCSSKLNPITWGEGAEYLNTSMVEYPVSGVLWYPHVRLYRSTTLVQVLDVVQLYIPALLGDTLCFLTGRMQKQSFVRLYEYFRKLNTATAPFRTKTWNFKSDNVTKVYNQMSRVDQDLFNFRVEEIDWPEYVESSWKGGLKYLPQAGTQTIEDSRARVKKLYYLQSFLQILVFGFLLYLLFNIVRLVL